VGKRQESREQIEARIVELGRRQLVDHGAGGLSVRAIARDLGMVSSAVYRYVSSRDELLTLLLVDAYSDLADAVDRARETCGPTTSSPSPGRHGGGPLRTRPAGRCYTAAPFPGITLRRSARSPSAPASWGRSSMPWPPELPPETSG
jgi:AcrR family transcriptional regulator